MPTSELRRTGLNPAWDEGYDEGHDEGSNDAGFVPMTRSEALALRQRSPSVSPWTVVAVQMFVGAACVLAVLMVTSRATATWSAFYGAAATVLPNALMARGMTRGARSSVAAAAGFMFWEMVKIGVAIAMLVIAARVVPGLSWPVLLVTMVLCIKVNWLALRWRGSLPKTTKA